MKPLFSMHFDLKKELLTTVRLATGGLCALVGFDLDTGEDFKVGVTEGLLLILHRGYREANVDFYLEQGLRVVLSGVNVREGEREQGAEEEISVALLQALVENLEMKKENGGFTIAFSFGTK